MCFNKNLHLASKNLNFILSAIFHNNLSYMCFNKNLHLLYNDFTVNFKQNKSLCRLYRKFYNTNAQACLNQVSPSRLQRHLYFPARML